MSDRNEAGNHHPWFTVLAATIIVICCLGAYVYFNNHGPVHQGQVVSVSGYPIHRELNTGSALGGVNGGPDIYDEEIVIADVKIKSTTKLPLFLHDMWADVTLSDGRVVQSSGASSEDYKKVFVAYPALAPQQKTPVARDITLSPGQEVEGQMIFHFPIAAKDWDARKQFDVVVGFLHQKDLVLHTMPVQQNTE
jgi:hypothetical protein